MFPWKSLGENSSLPLPVSGGLDRPRIEINPWCSLAGRCITLILSHRVFPFPSQGAFHPLSLSSQVSLKDTSHIGSVAHPTLPQCDFNLNFNYIYSDFISPIKSHSEVIGARSSTSLLCGIQFNLYQCPMCKLTFVLTNDLKLNLPAPYRQSDPPQFSSVQFSHSVMSDSLQPHEL